RVSVDSQPYVQGCWLDWPELRRVLLSDIRDLLPGADLEPVRTETVADDDRMLASLPVRLMPGPGAAVSPAGDSTVRLWLFAAWGGMGLAALALALLLAGALALSERRAAFVSAVTHELRSPLTTFRMYAEMLHDGMVTDEPRRRKYLATLRAEAGRLGHLVENVLSYARLENSRRTSRVETLSVAALLDRIAPRLAERAAQAGMELVVGNNEFPVLSSRFPEDRADRRTSPAGNRELGTGNGCSVRADPGAVEQILFNLVDNACKYAASAQDKRILLTSWRRRGRVSLAVRDQGPGVGPDVAGKLFRPFSRSAAEAAGSAPGVGLGLALSRRLARAMGGDLRREVGPGAGACFVLELPSA
ncbi:MAG TPA: HAMP domain-containing sensor histidine kinase, partial [Planctomycetota bacterium]|nr:HAMP domain-containing sensor histidine kinase [Planctomycetota bacterium]